MLASDLAEEAPHVLEDNSNNAFSQRLPLLESEKVRLVSSSMALASSSSRDVTNGIILDIDKRFSSAAGLLTPI